MGKVRAKVSNRFMVGKEGAWSSNVIQLIAWWSRYASHYVAPVKLHQRLCWQAGVIRMIKDYQDSI
jgi:hypothetical protein